MTVLRSFEIKLARAKEHIASLDEFIQEFFQDEPYAIRREIIEDGLIHILYWSKYIPVPERLGVLAGDAIHNLRSSLDHFAMTLSQEGSIAQTKTLTSCEASKIKFPICLSKPDFDKKIKQGYLLNAPSKGISYIERFQPFTLAYPKQHWLWHLSRLDNIDKHRQFIFTPLVPQLVRSNWPAALNDTKLEANKSPAAWGEGTELGRFIFSSPQSESNSPVELLAGFTLVIENFQQRWDIRHYLRDFLSGAEALLSGGFSQLFGP